MNISILIPTRHRTEYLLRALRSIAEQTCSLVNVEVVVVHDGQPCVFPTIPDYFPFDRSDWRDILLRLHSQRQAGKSAAINHAFHLSTGRYIYILDDDDFMHPTKLHTLRGLLDVVEEDIVWGLPKYVDMAGQPSCQTPNLPARFMSEHPVLTWDKFLKGQQWGVHGTSCMYRRATWEQAGPWDERLTGCEEWEYHMRLLHNGCTFRGVPVVTDYYRIHPGQKSGRKARRTAQRLAQRQLVRGRIEGWIKESACG